MWNRRHRRDETRAAGEALYRQVVQQARRPAFYAGGGVPDTLDGRFELILLHASLVVRRLSFDRERTAGLVQSLFDALIADMDANLREMGVGDLGVAPRIRKMAEAFYGRLGAYDRALRESGEALGGALRRNLFGTVTPSEAQVEAMAGYVRSESLALERLDDTALLAGQVGFGSPPQARG